MYFLLSWCRYSNNGLTVIFKQTGLSQAFDCASSSLQRPQVLFSRGRTNRWSRRHAVTSKQICSIDHQYTFILKAALLLQDRAQIQFILSNVGVRVSGPCVCFKVLDCHFVSVCLKEAADSQQHIELLGIFK